MDKTITEKRQFPRILASLPIRITPDFLGKTVDLSETGLRFILEKPLLLSKAEAKIELSPEESINTEFKVIWNKGLVGDGKFTYGACFIRLKEKDLANLRKLLIKFHLDSFLDKIKSADGKERIVNFWNKDFKEYLDRLVKVSNLLERGLDKEEGIKEVSDFVDIIMKKGNELEIFLDNKVIIKKIKSSFREVSGPWVYRSKIVKQAFEKPRGYPGDYGLLEIIYDNKAISQGIGYCIDRYFLDNFYAVAVRNRKDKMKEILFDFIDHSSSFPLKILNLACGSCREIKELFTDREFLPSDKEIFFSLVDQDEEALEFLKEALKNSHSKISFKFLQHNILDYINDGNKYMEILDRQDMIYSIGLTDYLPDRVLKSLLLFSFNLLNPKGKLIIAHKDASKYKPLPPDWWCDWVFYPRDESHLLDLVIKSGIKGFDIKVEREPSSIIFFVTIEKL